MGKAVRVTKADVVKAFTTWRKDVMGDYTAEEMLADSQRPPAEGAKEDAEYFFKLLSAK